jgi:hypothetical protein
LAGVNLSFAPNGILGFAVTSLRIGGTMKVLTRIEALKILGGIDGATLDRFMDEGLPFFYIGKSLKFVEKKIVEWYRSRKNGAAEVAAILGCSINLAEKFVSKYELEFDRDDNGNIIIDEGNLLAAIELAELDGPGIREQKKANRKARKEAGLTETVGTVPSESVPVKSAGLTESVGTVELATVENNQSPPVGIV